MIIVMKILDLRSGKVTAEQNTANKFSLKDYSIYSQPVILLWNEHLNKTNYEMQT